MKPYLLTFLLLLSPVPSVPSKNKELQEAMSKISKLDLAKLPF